MPPRKPTKAAMKKQLCDTHGIKFRGPAPPEAWPAGYTHLFQVIRKIAFTSYDAYLKSEVDDEVRVRRINQVREIKTRMFSIRWDGVNEDTWRLIEHYLLAIFEEEAVW